MKIFLIVRSELNQGRTSSPNNPDLKTDGNRLAGKAFLAKATGDSYKIKDESEMDNDTLKKYLEIKEYFNRAIINSKIAIQQKYITQQKINLHNSTNVLKSDQNQQDYTDTSLENINLYYSEEDGYYIPASIEIPMNVYVVGTVNVDETTYNFSPKVLDRSNVIEFNDIDLYEAFGFGATSNTTAHSYVHEEKLNFDIILPTSEDSKKIVSLYNQYFKIILSIFNLLEDNNKHFGYRVFNEISRYILNFNGENAKQIDMLVAIDLQVLQKILPKLNGTLEELDLLLANILIVCEDNNLSRSAAKLKRMINELRTHGFTTFIK